MSINVHSRLLALTCGLLLLTGLAAVAEQVGSKTSENASPKILILYFTPGENGGQDAVSSASVTKRNGRSVGMVRALAEMIQENAGGDLASINTSVKYPTDINKLIDYASDEQKRNSRPTITSTHANLKEYDVIFIGYPIWWYDLPMVMYSFFERYDLAGKRVIPFCVHNGSRFSSTIGRIAKAEPEAQVDDDGFTVSIQNIDSAGKDLARWVVGLKLKN